MAKQKKTVEEEEPEVYGNLDTVFDNYVEEEDVEDEGEEKSVEEAVVKDSGADTEKDSEEDGSAPAETEQEDTGEKEAEEAVVPDWEALGLPEYKGMTAEIVTRVRAQAKSERDYREKLYGTQSHELGELRKKVETPQKKEEEKPDFDVDEYHLLHEEDPTEAFRKYIGPTVDGMIQKALRNGAESGPIAEALQRQKDAAAFSQFMTEHGDATKYLSAMQLLDQPGNLGPQARSYRELYEVCKIAEQDPDLYNRVYYILQQYPTMPLADAKRQPSVVDISEDDGKPITQVGDRGKVLGEVKKMQSLSSKRTQTVVSKAPKVFATIEDAFDNVVD